jgi:hypothetical protein
MNYVERLSKSMQTDASALFDREGVFRFDLDGSITLFDCAGALAGTMSSALFDREGVFRFELDFFLEEGE